MERPNSFSKVIEELENSATAKEFCNRVETELEKLNSFVNDMKPHYEDLKSKGKAKLESEVQKNPLAAIGIVAVIAFLIGLLVSPRRSRGSD